ncbi:flagellin N-terminal helical domain-containing protein [Aeoliella sp. SH292]|uniref:flagellin N-terminal helical domain-containing protein n=1 Tax=Aeoliella sp. SH292 TaxID=3454464 RepID=UPI003F97DAA4
MAILPIPTTRVSDLLASNRLTQQLQSDQLALLRVQTQISTGRRVISPSDDAPASLRAMNLQRILERKLQTQTSLRDSVLFLGQAEKSVNEVTNILNSIKSEALGVDSTLATSQQRQAVVDQIDRAIEQLVNIGNSKFRERYLFAGSKSESQPYDYAGGMVAYNGNESHLRSYVDIGFLYETNIPGGEVFGGISQQVLGTADLNPHLTRGTSVDQINGGAGMARGAVEITYVNSLNQTTSKVVDLSNAATMDDVARYLQAGVPEGSGITVELTGTGLTLSTASPGDRVWVREVGEGRVARDLGIYTTAPQTTLVGTDITPTLQKTTKLADLLGTKAQATFTNGGANNDFFVTATQNGTRVDPSDPLSDPLNGVTVQFASGGTAGSETAVYDGSAGTLTVTIQPGETTAAQVVAAINNEASGLFKAQVDFRDSTAADAAGQGLVGLTNTAVTAGGSGESLDQTSGLLVSNGGQTVAVDISQAQTVEELLNILNQEELGLQVEINEAGTGINIRSRLSGADLTIGEVSGGRTASQLGVRTLNAETSLSGFNRGLGVMPDGVTKFTIELTTASVPTAYEIDIEGATTVQDVIDAIATQTGGAVTAGMVASGNGLQLTDTTTADSMRVTGQVAELLGFFETGEGEATSTTGSLSSGDRHTLETSSVFNTLIRLREALLSEDYPAIGREIEAIDADLDRVNFARSELGARLQSLQTVEYRHQDDEVAIRSALSNEIEVDLTAAITEFTQRQYAMQASLKVAGNMLQMTLLDFI